MDILELMEPITYENIHELKPGEWIWDNQNVIRSDHTRSLEKADIIEPYGFRMIDVLDLRSLNYYGGKPFMLSCVFDGHYHFDSAWAYFETGRFYKFKSERGDISNDSR